ncbi:TetR/AcrR family transcriptional regulator [Phaeobacter sp. A36a-5a]|uniref:TetR/AcrR family transcriptional regulator n=1 Tax=Phaeobacter bryozoorum TaxID=1086632 RepID=UPI0030C9C873
MSETRLQILDTGRKLTAQRGYTSVGLTELLSTAQVPKGSFYHYFASKEDYGCALLRHYVDQYRLELRHTLNDPEQSGRDQVLGYFRCWKDRQISGNAEQKCLIVKLAAEVSDLSADMRAILQHGVESIVARLSDCLRGAQADGSLATSVDPDQTATTLYQIWLGASLMAHLSQDGAPVETAMSQTLIMLPPPQS